MGGGTIFYDDRSVNNLVAFVREQTADPPGVTAGVTSSPPLGSSMPLPPVLAIILAQAKPSLRPAIHAKPRSLEQGRKYQRNLSSHFRGHKRGHLGESLHGGSLHAGVNLFVANLGIMTCDVVRCHGTDFL